MYKNTLKELSVSKNVENAIEFATKMHQGQERLDGTPYIRHPLNVAKYVLSYKKSDNLETLLISACLHDVIEDTQATYYDVVRLFGPQVASIVLELTNDEDLKREVGKTKYLEIKMKNMSSWALIIKLCDRLDNVSDLKSCSDSFRNKYIRETIEILEYLLERRKLSKTHLSIIKAILEVLDKTITLYNQNQYQIHLLDIDNKIRKLIPKENTSIN